MIIARPWNAYCTPWIASDRLHAVDDNGNHHLCAPLTAMNENLSFLQRHSVVLQPRLALSQRQYLIMASS